MYAPDGLILTSVMEQRAAFYAGANVNDPPRKRRGSQRHTITAPHEGNTLRHACVSHHDQDEQHPVFSLSGRRTPRHLIPSANRLRAVASDARTDSTAVDTQATTSGANDSTTTVVPTSSATLPTDAELSSLGEMMAATSPAREWLQKEVRVFARACLDTIT